MNTYHKSKKGFTLLEILIVIAALGILATIVILALNPGAIFADIRNGQRDSDMRDLSGALTQWGIGAAGDIGIGLDELLESSLLVAGADAPLDSEGNDPEVEFNPEDHNLEEYTRDDEGNIGERGVAFPLTNTSTAEDETLRNEFCQANGQGGVIDTLYDTSNGPIYEPLDVIDVDEAVSDDSDGLNERFEGLLQSQSLPTISEIADIPQDPQAVNCYVIQIPPGYTGQADGAPLQIAAPFAEASGEQDAPVITQDIRF